MQIQELARETAAAIVEAYNDSNDVTVFNIHIFLQEDGSDTRWENGTAYRVPYYGVHADTSYGGTEEALEAVRKYLPNALVELDNDEEDAWGKIAEEEGYSPVDFSLGVSIEVEKLL